MDTRKLTILGREIEPAYLGPYTNWTIVLGGARLSVTWHEVRHADARVKFGEVDLSHYEFDTKELARDWLESEARRIMRECFEIAGPMIVDERGNDTFMGVPIPPISMIESGPLKNASPVRFRDC